MSPEAAQKHDDAKMRQTLAWASSIKGVSVEFE